MVEAVLETKTTESSEGGAAAPASSTGVTASPAACRVLREGVFGLWPKLGRAPTTREIALALKMTPNEVDAALEQLSAQDTRCNGRVERPHNSDRIAYAWPLSNIPTEYVVILEGQRPVYARCAIDALGVSSMYGTRARIEVTSVSSGRTIHLTVNGKTLEHLDPTTAVVWEGKTCDQMHLFADSDDLARWQADVGDSTISLEKATAAGVEIFGSRLAD